MRWISLLDPLAAEDAAPPWGYVRHNSPWYKMAAQLLKLSLVMTWKNVPAGGQPGHAMLQGFEKHRDNAYKDNGINWLANLYKLYDL